jgi:hypothetical protein
MRFRLNPTIFDQQWAGQKPFWVSHVLTLDSASVGQTYAALSADSYNHFIYNLSPTITVLGFAPDHVLVKADNNYINHAQYLANGQLRLRQEIDDYKQADFAFPPQHCNTANVDTWFGTDLPNDHVLAPFLPQGFYIHPRLLVVFDSAQHTLSLHANIAPQQNADPVNSLIQAETLIENALSKLAQGTYMWPLHSVLPTPTSNVLWADVTNMGAYIKMHFVASALCLYRQLCRFYTPHSLQLFCVDNHTVILHNNEPLAVLHDEQLLLPQGDSTEQLLHAAYAAEYG